MGWTFTDGTGAPVVSDGEAVAPRLVLLHLNVTVPAGDSRSADEIARAVFFGALDGERLGGLTVDMPLAEEV